MSGTLEYGEKKAKQLWLLVASNLVRQDSVDNKKKKITGMYHTGEYDSNVGCLYWLNDHWVNKTRRIYIRQSGLIP